MANTKNNTPPLIVRDWLAIERTKLANERTFLAYFRTAIFFLATGIGLLKISWLHEVDELGYFFIILTPIMLTIGVFRLRRMRKLIRQYYKQQDAD